MTLLIASYNIQYGLGQDGIFDITRAADVVAQADIICLQEVTQHWRRNGYEDQAALITERLNRYSVFGATLDIDASTVDADGRISNRRRTFGNMVLSRWPIRSSRTLALPKRAARGIRDLQRCVVEAVIDAPAGALRVYSVHFSHISAQQRVPQAEALRDIVAWAPEDGAPIDLGNTDPDDPWSEGAGDLFPPGPAIVAGDFNAPPESPEFAVLCGERVPRYGRVRRGDQLVDTWTVVGHDEHAPSTFDAKQTGYKIDHVLATPDLAARAMRSWIDRATEVSDHFPVWVEFDWGN